MFVCVCLQVVVCGTTLFAHPTNICTHLNVHVYSSVYRKCTAVVYACKPMVNIYTQHTGQIQINAQNIRVQHTKRKEKPSGYIHTCTTYCTPNQHAYNYTHIDLYIRERILVHIAVCCLFYTTNLLLPPRQLLHKSLPLPSLPPPTLENGSSNNNNSITVNTIRKGEYSSKTNTNMAVPIFAEGKLFYFCKHIHACINVKREHTGGCTERGTDFMRKNRRITQWNNNNKNGKDNNNSSRSSNRAK